MIIMVWALIICVTYLLFIALSFMNFYVYSRNACYKANNMSGRWFETNKTILSTAFKTLESK